MRKLPAIGLLAACCIQCSPESSLPPDYTSFIDTTVSTYGPYIAVKLPIEKGVAISNPIQIALGPDSILYAANQNGEVYSLRDTDSDGLEDLALLYCNVKDVGLRSPAGFTELNRLVPNAFYGHNPIKYPTDSITGPVLALQTEAAPSGIEFNAAHNHFGGTGGQLFVAFYGPGEFWTRGGIGRVNIQQLADGSYTYEEFPVADIPKLSDLAFGKGGSLYLSQHGKADYWYNTVYENEGNFYKLIYDPSRVSTPAKQRIVAARILSDNSIEAGRQLFAERACLGCHGVDGTTELLGPNLKEAGKRFSRQEILEEILEPSKRIKPSMMAQRIIKKDGRVLLGRIVNANEKQVSIMLVGNHVVQIDRNQILRIEDEEKSLMYEGLLKGLSDTETEALVDYLVSLSQ